MSASPTPIPDSNFVAGIPIVSGAPLQDGDLLVFNTALNGWVFEPAGAIGVTLANLAINVDKDWLDRTILNIGDLGFNKGTAFVFGNTLAGGFSEFDTVPLDTTAALTGLAVRHSDREAETIQRLIEYKSSRIIDKINQTATTASLPAVYQMEAVINPSNDVAAGDAIIEYSVLAGTSAIANRSLFQINNLLTTALELTLTDLKIFGDIVFTASRL